MEITIDKKIDQWFEDRGIVANGKTMSQAIKTLEETTELIDAINTNNLLEIIDAVGDIYVTLRGVCVVQGIDLDDCAKLAYNEIKDRKGHLRADGTFVKEHDRLPEKLMSDETDARMDIIGQNGNDGLHYTPQPGPLDGKMFTQQQFDEVAEKVDEEYGHTKEYYDTERNKSTNDNIYVKDKETGRNKQMSSKEYFNSLPDVVHSTEVKERAVWRYNTHDPKIIPFKEDSKDVD
jgi:phosphoribosyl-ATP pyrophosphohydrolase